MSDLRKQAECIVSFFPDWVSTMEIILQVTGVGYLDVDRVAHFPPAYFYHSSFLLLITEQSDKNSVECSQMQAKMNRICDQINPVLNLQLCFLFCFVFLVSNINSLCINFLCSLTPTFTTFLCRVQEGIQNVWGICLASIYAWNELYPLFNMHSITTLVTSFPPPDLHQR